MTVRSVNMAAVADGPQSSVRKRRGDSRKTETNRVDSRENDGAKTDGDPEKERNPVSLRTGTFWLTRVVLLRAVAFIYRE